MCGFFSPVSSLGAHWKDSQKALIPCNLNSTILINLLAFTWEYYSENGGYRCLHVHCIGGCTAYLHTEMPQVSPIHEYCISTTWSATTTWVSHDYRMSTTWVLHEYCTIGHYHMRITWLLHDRPVSPEYHMITAWIPHECCMNTARMATTTWESHDYCMSTTWVSHEYPISICMTPQWRNKMHTVYSLQNQSWKQTNCLNILIPVSDAQYFCSIFLEGFLPPNCNADGNKSPVFTHLWHVQPCDGNNIATQVLQVQLKVKCNAWSNFYLLWSKLSCEIST